MKKPRVLLADDHKIVIEGLKSLLSDEFDLLGHVEDGRALVEQAAARRPDVIVAEFFYAYGTNYSSNHISNLDTLLITLQKYPDYQPKIIVLVTKQEQQFVSKLEEHYKLDQVLVQPVTEQQMRSLL